MDKSRAKAATRLKFYPNPLFFAPNSSYWLFPPVYIPILLSDNKTRRWYYNILELILLLHLWNINKKI